MHHANGGWEIENLPHGQNIRPMDDAIIHTRDASCPCFPKVVLVGYECYHDNAAKLAIRKQIQHNAIDGRK